MIIFILSPPQSFVDVWLAQDTDKARFMDKISRHTRTTERYQKELVAGPGFNSCDTYALAAAIDDALVTESEESKSVTVHQLRSSTQEPNGKSTESSESRATARRASLLRVNQRPSPTQPDVD
ncbi:hypothetical protein D9C73_000487 [Collichthys lucidus]|uniref:Uncharacterized protein n=1 Tax=Collichthys lucidus TaxID=240159 RepID=A0A4U5TZM1_COLLU|nr:hypothetical protein D9C73_000487 [Collichthys lucidus]